METYQTVSPASGEVLETFAQSSNSEIQQALATAQQCYEDTWRHSTFSERRQIVARAAALLRENAEENAQLITSEMGKLIDQARFEINVSADILSYYANNAEIFLKDGLISERNAKLITEPIGIILAIEPWNFPYYQLARVAGPQIMAGNVVVAKPAPNTPRCALAFAQLFEEAHAPQGVYTNLFCGIQQVNDMIDDFRVRGVTLTGSERAGAAVAERAGKNLKKVVLELGGSDAALVLDDADLDKVVEMVAVGRLMCMGQACAATKRVIVVGKSRSEAFIEALSNWFSGLQVGEPTDSKTTIGPVASKRGLNLILSQISEAAKKGARIITGGQQIQRPGFYMEPTIITDIAPENPLFQQETFGPVLSVYTVQSESEAVNLANATQFGLGASVFGADNGNTQRVARKLECGQVFINCMPTTSAEVPWGGVKNSGFGKELGELGILEFVNRKVIVGE